MHSFFSHFILNRISKNVELCQHLASVVSRVCFDYILLFAHAAAVIILAVSSISWRYGNRYGELYMRESHDYCLIHVGTHTSRVEMYVSNSNTITGADTGRHGPSPTRRRNGGGPRHSTGPGADRGVAESQSGLAIVSRPSSRSTSTTVRSRWMSADASTMRELSGSRA